MTAVVTLLIGYGNPGRGDDGLGPAFARRIAARQLPNLSVEIDYQLTVDHAAMIAGVQRVVFADAALDAKSPFYFQPIAPFTEGSLESHDISPQSAMLLSRLLFGAEPPAYILGLRGAAFGEMAEMLSSTARDSLQRAESFFLKWHADSAA